MDIVTDLGNMTSVIDFIVDTIVSIAQTFTQWPLVLVPSVAVGGIIFAKAKGLMKLRR